MMFRIRRRHLTEGWSETLTQTKDPCEAYEYAHAFDAEFMGEGFAIEIVDEHNNNMWHYCARRRCPSVGKLQ